MGDSLNVMRQMPDGCVDLVVTDPPYNLGIDYGAQVDDNVPLSEYRSWLRGHISEAERVLVDGGLLFMWQSMKHLREVWQDYPKARCMAVCNNFVQIYGISVEYAFDPVLFWHKGERGRKGQGAGLNRDWFLSNTASNKTRIKWHPCGRPLDVVNYLVDQWSREGDLVFDPFMGSGTTAVAAKKLGRHYFGCDINPDYVRMANERVAQVDGTQLELIP
ncbi:MAG: site-specific DNA-methyltransferase [Chloroflexi bacterium]|nr:site-specific DNA-methyltransferase [Chloroflexota bacterium]